MTRPLACLRNTCVRNRRRGFVPIAGVSLLVLSPNVLAQTAWEPYDRFGSGTLDPRAWIVARDPIDVPNLGQRLEVVGASLRLESRSAAATSLSVDAANPTSTPVSVRALRAAVTLRKGTRAKGCDKPGSGPTLSRAGLVCRFFHDAAAGADVGALFYIQHSSDNQLTLNAAVRHCADAPCTTGADIWSKELGPLSRQTITLAIAWRGAAEEIVFTREGYAPMAVPVVGRNTGPPAFDKKGIQLWHTPAACPKGDAPYAQIKLLVDDVDVNSGAVPVR